MDSAICLLSRNITNNIYLTKNSANGMILKIRQSFCDLDNNSANCPFTETIAELWTIETGVLILLTTLLLLIRQPIRVVQFDLSLSILSYHD
jgi:hypothetical protein